MIVLSIIYIHCSGSQTFYLAYEPKNNMVNILLSLHVAYVYHFNQSAFFIVVSCITCIEELDSFLTLIKVPYV